jgi:hypothetical protein
MKSVRPLTKMLLAALVALACEEHIDVGRTRSDASDTGRAGAEPSGNCVDSTSCAAGDEACMAMSHCETGDGGGTCAAPLLVCNELCVDPQNDPLNCGQCGRVCATFACRAGICEQ